MSLLQYEYFIATYEQGSYRKAAQELFRSDGAIKKQIDSLERNLGVRLFETNRGRLTPTPIAQPLYEQCKIVLYEAKKIPEIIQCHNPEKPETISIAVAYQPTRGAIMPIRIKRYFTSLFPETKIEIVAYPNSECANAVRENVVHGAFALSKDFEDLNVVQDIFSFKPMLMVSKYDDLAKQNSVSKGDLTGRNFALPVDVGVFYKAFKNYTDSVADSKTSSPGFLAEKHREFFDNGGCLFVTPDKRLEKFYPDAVMLPISDFNNELTVSLITKKGTTPQTKLLSNFAAALKKKITENASLN